jgi:hypothetical protein
LHMIWDFKLLPLAKWNCWLAATWTRRVFHICHGIFDFIIVCHGIFIIRKIRRIMTSAARF